MAEIVGESGAWKGISDDLLRRGLQVSKPGDITQMVLHLQGTFKPSVEKKTAEAASSIKLVEDRITALRNEAGFFRSILNWFIILRCRFNIYRITSERDRHIEALTENIEKLESLQHSPELAGAQAELGVITQLSRLPADCVVFNDVRLRATRYIRFNGVALQSAQIDHLVLSPAGIFVIETKEWSKSFVESGDYHDPFDQVARATYLCYVSVKSFGKVQVRSIIACAGHLPSKPPDAKVKVLRVDELAGYISWFKDKELKPELFSQLKQFLGNHVGAIDRFGGISMLSDTVFVRKRNSGMSWKGTLFFSVLFFASSHFIKGVHVGGYFHLERIFSIAFFIFGGFFLAVSGIVFLAAVIKKRLVNKVTATTGINVSGYSLRKKYSLVGSIVSLITALLPFLTSKLQGKLARTQNTGSSVAPTQHLKSRATLIPTEPPPLTKEERDRKYMSPSMRAELEAKDKPFKDANPTCPHCNKPMVLRVANQAPASDTRFWGCVNYPACRYTVPFMDQP